MSREKEEGSISEEILKYPIKIRGLLLDIDGVLISERNGLPSPLVTQKIAEAQSSGVRIGVATTKTIRGARPIIKHLGLIGPSILNTGATIVDAQSEKLIWQQTLLRNDIDHVASIVGEESIEIRNAYEYGTLSSTYYPKDPIGLYLYSLSIEKADQLTQQLAEISTIAVHRIVSDTEGSIDLDITQVKVSKGYGAAFVAGFWGIDPSEIMAVGDGYQDSSLLRFCGHGVAMENAVLALKKDADYVTSSVKNNGVAHAIDKFILQI